MMFDPDSTMEYESQHQIMVPGNSAGDLFWDGESVTPFQKFAGNLHVLLFQSFADPKPCNIAV